MQQVRAVQSRGVNPDQNLALPRNGPLNVCKLKDFRPARGRYDKGFHTPDRDVCIFLFYRHFGNLFTHRMLVSSRQGSYPVRFASRTALPDALREVGLAPRPALLVTDIHVNALHGDAWVRTLEAAGFPITRIVLPAGEATKSPEHLGAIYDAALGAGIERQTPLFALGGGVVGDLAGFAAATLLRGLPLVHLPTTAIAQTDSAIGGKTGLNHAVGKNLIGAFYPPRLVFADPDTLLTLPEREWTSGLAEALKHALIADRTLLYEMEALWPSILSRDPETVRWLMPRAAAVKVQIVSEDEFERGRRALLNFGHTFGHAFEREAGYGVLTHGEAVALGMRAALFASKRVFPALDVEPLDALIAQLPVPNPGPLSLDALVAATRADKKVEHGTVRAILLQEAGNAVVHPLDAQALHEAFAHALTVNASR